MDSAGLTALHLEVAGRRFAVETGQVMALRRRATLYPRREGPPELLGFLPFGGWAVPVLNVDARLEVGTPQRRQPGLLLVAALEPAPLAFQVDRIGDTITVPWERVALLPELLASLISRPVVWGLIWRGDQLVPLLDLEQLVSPEEAAALREHAQIHEGGRDEGREGH